MESWKVKLSVKLWRFGRVINWLGSRPVLDRLMEPLFSAEGHEAIIIPVNEAVGATESMVLPYPLLTPLVEQASHRTILSGCLCRRGENCRAYPHDVGCLFLGDGAAQIAPALGRAATVDEALVHIEQALGAGLTPLIVHASFDAWLLDIPYQRMAAICFCCDCCCTVRHGLRQGPAAFWETVVRLPGLRVVVGPGCTACGICLNACHVRAISMSPDGGQAAIADRCKGCGRCVAVCPAGAITMRLADDADIVDHLLARIERRTDIKGSSE